MWIIVIDNIINKRVENNNNNHFIPGKKETLTGKSNLFWVLFLVLSLSDKPDKP